MGKRNLLGFFDDKQDKIDVINEYESKKNVEKCYFTDKSKKYHQKINKFKKLACQLLINKGVK